MKRISVLFLTILLLTSALSGKVFIGTDLRDIDSAFYGSMRLDVEAGFRHEELRFMFPISYAQSYEEDFYYFDGGVSICVYPFENLGLYLGTTLFSGGYLLGQAAPDDNFLLSAKAFAGWTFSFPYFYIEPRITFFDIFSSADSTVSGLKANVKQYSKCRLSLYMGVEF